MGLTVGSLQSAFSVALSSSTLWGPMDCSPPGSSDHGISQTRILEWVVISFSRRSFCIHSRDEPASPASLALADGFFITKPPGKPHGIEARITIISGEKEGKKTTLLVCKALSEWEKANKERGGWNSDWGVSMGCRKPLMVAGSDYWKSLWA